MSHYLEHTLDPRAELAAAHRALADGGCLLIEVSDPDYKLGRVLGKYWLPWFQPQHLHCSEPLVWHRGAAHQRVDFFFASYLLLDRIAPSGRLPWRPRRGALGSAWRVLGPLLSRARVSNTYRVLAKKR